MGNLGLKPQAESLCPFGTAALKAEGSLGVHHDAPLLTTATLPVAQ
jgi:hypothetical protein